MMLGVDDNDETLKAVVVSIYNSAYSAGWAAGPLLGGVLLDSFDGSDGHKFSMFSSLVALFSLALAIVMHTLAFLRVGQPDHVQEVKASSCDLLRPHAAYSGSPSRRPSELPRISRVSELSVPASRQPTERTAPPCAPVSRTSQGPRVSGLDNTLNEPLVQ